MADWCALFVAVVCCWSTRFANRDLTTVLSSRCSNAIADFQPAWVRTNATFCRVARHHSERWGFASFSNNDIGVFRT